MTTKTPKGRCDWVEDYESNWTATCNDEIFVFTTDGVEENGFKFCPYCGKTIKINRYKEDL
jgi:rRNA maturation endonuclease Nob1